jgi:DNA-binding NtrC family response regulator
MSTEQVVLIVDDEPNVRRVLSALLRRDAYRTLEAGDGEEALQVLDAEAVHAVVADLKMPRMNGLELLEAVQKRHPGVPVVLLTAHGTVGSAVEALKRGALDYLTKPYDPEEVRQVVAKAVKTCALDSREAQTEVDDCESWSGSHRRRPRSSSRVRAEPGRSWWRAASTDAARGRAPPS